MPIYLENVKTYLFCSKIFEKVKKSIKDACKSSNDTVLILKFDQTSATNGFFDEENHVFSHFY